MLISKTYYLPDQDRVRWWEFVKAVMKFGSIKCGEYLDY
jgi:hypothetical protein